MHAFPPGPGVKEMQRLLAEARPSTLKCVSRARLSLACAAALARLVLAAAPAGTLEAWIQRLLLRLSAKTSQAAAAAVAVAGAGAPASGAGGRVSWTVSLLAFLLRTGLSLAAFAAALPLLVSALAQRLDARRKQVELARQPRRIIIIRHCESEGNVNLRVLAATPDSQLRLTDKGRQQARLVGVQLRALVGDEPCRFFVSPYLRTRETFEGILAALRPPVYSMREEPRVRRG